MSDFPNLAKFDYVARINRAIDYVLQNLEQPLALADVAAAAAFSPFHFHRIFKALVGETLASFVKRVRLERTVTMMAHRPHVSFTSIALACGFSSSSDFSRNFRSHFGVAPRKFNIAEHQSLRRQDLFIERLPSGTNPDGFNVQVVEVSARRTMYLRVWKPFEPGKVQTAADRLVRWAQNKGLAGGQWFGSMWDDPEIVPLEKCRYDVAVEVPRQVVGEEDFGIGEFPAMKVARLPVRGPIELEMRALDYLYTQWLPASGFVPAQLPVFEVWSGLPFAHGGNHFELSIEIPLADAPG